MEIAYWIFSIFNARVIVEVVLSRSVKYKVYSPGCPVSEISYSIFPIFAGFGHMNDLLTPFWFRR